MSDSGKDWGASSEEAIRAYNAARKPKTAEQIEQALMASEVSVQLARDTLEGLLSKQEQLRKDLALARYGVSYGSVVKTKKHGECRVLEILTGKWRDKPWLMVNTKKKDGSWGDNRVNAYDDWEVVK